MHQLANVIKNYATMKLLVIKWYSATASHLNAGWNAGYGGGPNVSRTTRQGFHPLNLDFRDAILLMSYSLSIYQVRCVGDVAYILVQRPWWWRRKVADECDNITVHHQRKRRADDMWPMFRKVRGRVARLMIVCLRRRAEKKNFEVKSQLRGR
jgi:hypothetical protein